MAGKTVKIRRYGFHVVQSKSTSYQDARAGPTSAGSRLSRSTVTDPSDTQMVVVRAELWPPLALGHLENSLRALRSFLVPNKCTILFARKTGRDSGTGGIIYPCHKRVCIPVNVRFAVRALIPLLPLVLLWRNHATRQHCRRTSSHNQ